MTTGDKVVCVDDYFAPEIAALLQQFPKDGQTYVIREVFEGESIDDGRPAKRVLTLLLTGIYNPRQTIPPFHERGFNAKRFRPLEELKKVQVDDIDCVGVNDGDVRIYEPANH